MIFSSAKGKKNPISQGGGNKSALEQVQTLFDTTAGEMLLTAAVSMIPVVELRGGIPFGTALGLNRWLALLAAVAGNMLPAPLIIVYIRRVLLWLRRRFPRLQRLVDTLERKANLKGEAVERFQSLGLYILVAVPLPGTGAWTGALVAAFLNLRLRRALPPIFLGVVTAGMIITFLTRTVTLAIGA